MSKEYEKHIKENLSRFLEARESLDAELEEFRKACSAAEYKLSNGYKAENLDVMSLIVYIEKQCDSLKQRMNDKEALWENLVNTALDDLGLDESVCYAQDDAEEIGNLFLKDGQIYFHTIQFAKPLAFNIESNEDELYDGFKMLAECFVPEQRTEFKKTIQLRADEIDRIHEEIMYGKSFFEKEIPFEDGHVLTLQLKAESQISFTCNGVLRDQRGNTCDMTVPKPTLFIGKWVTKDEGVRYSLKVEPAEREYEHVRERDMTAPKKKANKVREME